MSSNAEHQELVNQMLDSEYIKPFGFEAIKQQALNINAFMLVLKKDKIKATLIINKQNAFSVYLRVEYNNTEIDAQIEKSFGHSGLIDFNLAICHTSTFISKFNAAVSAFESALLLGYNPADGEE